MRLWTRWRCAVILATWLGLLASTTAATAAESPTLSQEVEGLWRVVSLTGYEAPAVRYICQRPDGLPVVEDTLGNLTVRLGSGRLRRLLVCSLDEAGFQVASIGTDECLLVQPRGGLYTSLWEAQSGLVHTAREAVPAVFEPRRDWHTAAQRTPPGQLTVFIGATSRPTAEALGIQIGQTVTMPKCMVRLGRHRVLARSRGIPLQSGMTAGWNDGASCAANGVVNVPLSWPGRYSHSPVEVADLRDIEALVQLIVTLDVQ
jgi:putative aminopeptidase FrvX